MASIKSLLNPAPELPVHDTPRFGVSYTFPSISMTRSLHPGRHKIPVKYKIPKDAPIFKENDPQGEIRYPPCEDRPDPIDKEHRKMELYPMEPDAKIGRYPRTIPYRSEKKSFEERTGRSRFEGMCFLMQILLCYTNQIPIPSVPVYVPLRGHRREMDYDVGL